MGGAEEEEGMTSRWREHARPIIARVLAETKGKPENEIRKALRDAYPFGPREYHPYKIWLDEVARQRGRKVTPERIGPRRKKAADDVRGQLRF